MGSASHIVIIIGADSEKTAHCYNKRGHEVDKPDTANDNVCGGSFATIDFGDDPTRPEHLGCCGTSHVHDTCCTIHGGPDTDRFGKEICISSKESHMDIADMTTL